MGKKKKKLQTILLIYIYIYIYIPKRGHVAAETRDFGRPSGWWKRGEGRER
jgi:hypothetical protein